MDNQTAPDVVISAVPSAAPTRKLPVIIAFIALLVAIGSLAICYIVVRDVRQEHSTTNQEIQSLSKSHDDNQSQFMQAQQTASENAENIKKVQAQLVTLGTSLQEVTAANQAAERRLRYSEIEYVVRLAHLNLHFQKNQTVALALLQHADDQLRGLNDASNTAFRESLNHTLSQLKALPSVDMTGILSQLTAVEKEIDKLPMLSVILPKAEQANADAKGQEKNRGFWRVFWETSVDQLQHFVTIRRLDQPIKPLLAEADQTLLTRTIQYLLQQAEWAVTQQNVAVYKQSLTDAENMIRTHYNLTATSTDSVLVQLKHLQEQPISNDYPDISELVKSAGNLRPRATSPAGAHTS